MAKRKRVAGADVEKYLQQSEPDRQEWFCEQCDLELLVEGTVLPVHRLFVAQWLLVLSDCIVSTAAALPDSSSTVPQLPVEAKLSAMRLLLELIYNASPMCKLQELAASDSSDLQDVVLLAHKLDCPVLLEHTEQALLATEVTMPLGRVIQLTRLAHATGMSELLGVYERELTYEAARLVVHEQADQLPAEVLVRILKGVLNHDKVY